MKDSVARVTRAANWQRAAANTAFCVGKTDHNTPGVPGQTGWIGGCVGRIVAKWQRREDGRALALELPNEVAPAARQRPGAVAKPQGE